MYLYTYIKTYIHIYIQAYIHKYKYSHTNGHIYIHSNMILEKSISITSFCKCSSKREFRLGLVVADGILLIPFRILPQCYIMGLHEILGEEENHLAILCIRNIRHVIYSWHCNLQQTMNYSLPAQTEQIGMAAIQLMSPWSVVLENSSRRNSCSDTSFNRGSGNPPRHSRADVLVRSAMPDGSHAPDSCAAPQLGLSRKRCSASCRTSLKLWL